MLFVTFSTGLLLGILLGYLFFEVRVMNIYRKHYPELRIIKKGEFHYFSIKGCPNGDFEEIIGKLQAIKLVRHLWEIGLMDAKNFVEDYGIISHSTNPNHYHSFIQRVNDEIVERNIRKI